MGIIVVVGDCGGMVIWVLLVGVVVFSLVGWLLFV